MTRLRSMLGSSTSVLTLSSLSLGSSFLTEPNSNNLHRHRPLFMSSQSQFLESPSSGDKAVTSLMTSTADAKINTDELSLEGKWSDLLPYEKWSHNSAKISVPTLDDEMHTEDDPFDRSKYKEYLENTVAAMRELGKSSLWVEVPMSRASLIEEMADVGFEFHHANGAVANLNIWLKDTESKVPEYATHHVGVGAVVINSRDEILCVRELRRNFMPWKVPGGLADLGEQIPDAAEREVLEETGIATEFHSILSFRHTHGMNNGRSDLYFVCRLNPVEETAEDSDEVIISDPVPQACEIESAAWVPLDEYKAMVRGEDGGTGHPMMRHVMKILEQGKAIKKKTVHSVVPGRQPNPMYHPDIVSDDASIN